MNAFVAAAGTDYMGGGAVAVALDGVDGARRWEYTVSRDEKWPDQIGALAAADGAVYVACQAAAISLDGTLTQGRLHPVLRPSTTPARAETYGIVTRTAYPEIPPRVEYRLTPHGEGLRDVLDTMATWATSIPDPTPA